MKSAFIVASFVCTALFMSCKKEKIIQDDGVQTILKGHVEDPIRGINISGYKIVLVKEVGMDCGGWMCGTKFETVGETYTDSNGDYLIKFIYKAEPGQGYYLAEQYYGSPYFPEAAWSSGPIAGGKINIIDITAWQPIRLKINVQVLNNSINDLRLRVDFNGDKTLNATEFIYETNTTKTYTLMTRPGSNVNIFFWYYTGTVLHQKTIPYTTTLDPLTDVDLIVDCSTF